MLLYYKDLPCFVSFCQCQKRTTMGHQQVRGQATRPVSYKSAIWRPSKQRSLMILATLIPSHISMSNRPYVRSLHLYEAMPVFAVIVVVNMYGESQVHFRMVGGSVLRCAVANQVYPDIMARHTTKGLEPKRVLALPLRRRG